MAKSFIPYGAEKKLHKDVIELYESDISIDDFHIVNYYRFNNCGTFQYENPRTKQPRYSRCNNYLCPICTKRKHGRLNKKTELIDKKLARTGYLSQMVTITPYKDVERDGALKRYNELAEKCRKLFNKKSYKNRAYGSIKAIDTSFSDTGLYHVHIHLLVVCKKEHLDDLKRIIDNNFADDHIHYSETYDKIRTNWFFRYVLKYNKYDEMSAENWILRKTFLKGKQALSFTGKLKKIKP